MLSFNFNKKKETGRKFFYNCVSGEESADQAGANVRIEKTNKGLNKNSR